jgi:hypothetical protein
VTAPANKVNGNNTHKKKKIGGKLLVGKGDDKPPHRPPSLNINLSSCGGTQRIPEVNFTPEEDVSR